MALTQYKKNQRLTFINKQGIFRYYYYFVIVALKDGRDC